MGDHVRACEEFCEALKERLALPGAVFSEDQLKSPVDELLRKIAELYGLGKVEAATEQHLSEQKVRPDISVYIDGLICGHVELKKPGLGADAPALKGRHNKEQWERLKNLPNLLYSDGREWALYRNGERVAEVVRFREDMALQHCPVVDGESARLLDVLLQNFLRWEAIVPHDPKKLAEYLAPLTRFLRDEIAQGLEREGSRVARLQKDLNRFFPDIEGADFADAGAQTVTYSLFLARLEGARDLSPEKAVEQLQKQNPILSKVLDSFTQAKGELRAGFALLQRALQSLNVTDFLKANLDMGMYFYEDFLAAYDPKLRKDAGVYYTPKEVVALQMRLAEELLETHFGKVDGFASDDVVLLDPAVGTGSYLIEALHRGMERVKRNYGVGEVAGRARRMVENMHGFELLVGAYAVARLQLTKAVKGYQMQEGEGEQEDVPLHIHLADTLTNPYRKFTEPPLPYEELAQEYESARLVKEGGNILVCVGNPPYDRQTIEQGDETTRRRGGWVRFGDDAGENGNAGKQGRTPILEDFLKPAREADAGVHLKSLYNDYVYFWRWALWRMFEQQDCGGIISFITASSYLRGPGFVGMRQVMRETFDELWILDLEGGSLGARKSANVFSIRTPVAIAIGVRGVEARPQTPARVRYAKIADVSREEKLRMLGEIEQLDADKVFPARGQERFGAALPEFALEWRDCPTEWQAPFIPAGEGAFFDWPALPDLFPWHHSGCQFQRTWPIGETREVLKERWERLVSAAPEKRAEFFRETRDKKITFVGASGKGEKATVQDLGKDAAMPPVLPYSYRCFDNRFVMFDDRVCDYPRPVLWNTHPDKRLFFTSARSQVMGRGAAMGVAQHMPDLIHFPSGGGKDTIPLYRDWDGEEVNITRGLLEMLGGQYGFPVSAEDFATYVYALLGGQGYTARFWRELETPGARIPISKDGELFKEGAELGSRLIWLHSYGQRFRDEGQGRGAQVPQGEARSIRGIPVEERDYPESAKLVGKEIHVGKGRFGPVARGVWEYEVSGLQVVQSWLGYRMKKRKGRRSSPLDDIRPRQWTPEMSEEFLKLLWIVEATLAMEGDLADVLERVVGGDCYTAAELPAPEPEQKKPPKPAADGADLQVG